MSVQEHAVAGDTETSVATATQTTVESGRPAARESRTVTAAATGVLDVAARTEGTGLVGGLESGTGRRRHRVARGLAIVGLAVTAWVHAPVAVQHWAELPYLGAAFALLVVASAALAGSLLVEDSRVVWTASLVLTSGAVVLYAVSRQVGLPGAADDIGDWTSSAGLVAVGSELLVSVVAASVLLRRVRRGRRAPA